MKRLIKKNWKGCVSAIVTYAAVYILRPDLNYFLAWAVVLLLHFAMILMFEEMREEDENPK